MDTHLKYINHAINLIIYKIYISLDYAFLLYIVILVIACYPNDLGVVYRTSVFSTAPSVKKKKGEKKTHTHKDK